MGGLRGLWREFANAAAAASRFRKSSCRGFRLVWRRDAEFCLRPEGIFHLARIIYTHALATSQNSPRMFHAEINVQPLHLSENETACLKDSVECCIVKLVYARKSNCYSVSEFILIQKLFRCKEKEFLDRKVNPYLDLYSKLKNIIWNSTLYTTIMREMQFY